MNRFLVSLLLALFLAFPAFGFGSHEASPRYLVHLLDYIAMDYAGAANGGKVVNATEYQEQKEFIEAAMTTEKNLPQTSRQPDIAQGLRDLQGLIDRRADATDVKVLARRVEGKVIQISGIEVAPSRWPDRNAGHKLFQKNCEVCHGVTGHGDGPAGTNLRPPPANLHDPKMASNAPFQIFNAIRLGVPGTGMVPFTALSDGEVWDLAFYVNSLRYDVSAGETEAPPPGVIPSLSLKEVATTSDEDILKRLEGPEIERHRQLARLRLYTPPKADLPTLELAKQKLASVISDLRSGDAVQARQDAIVAYLEGVEPVEPALRAKNQAFTTELEEKMAEVRSLVDKASPEAVTVSVGKATEALSRAELMLEERTSSAWVTFSIAAGIFFREGFEAALIIITLLGVVKSIGSRRAAVYLHIGWGAALFVGLVCWFFSGWVMAISGAGREMLEGVISIAAVIVLLYLGFWLHRKTEIGKWQSFIGEMVKTALSGKKLIGLAAVAFMAVFRESLETVLFLRALTLESEGQHGLAMLAGVIFALVAVLFLASLAVRFSTRLPLRQLFSISSLVMILLALILVGKAFHSFQEVGLLPITRLPIILNFDLVGLYPTYETTVPQLVLVLLSLAAWFLGKRQSVRAA